MNTNRTFKVMGRVGNIGQNLTEIGMGDSAVAACGTYSVPVILGLFFPNRDCLVVKVFLRLFVRPLFLVARDAQFVTALRMKDFFDEAGHKPAASSKES